jgi:WD40 repeat protein
MFGNNQVCSLCVSETGFKGCICSGTIKLIGSNCLLNHLSESEIDHRLVDLDLALRIQADPSTIQDLRFKLQEKDPIMEELSKQVNNSQLPLQQYNNSHTLTEHTDDVNSVSISGDGRWIVSGSLDKTVRVWSVAKKTQEAVLTGHTDEVRSVCMSGDGRWIVSGSYDSTVRIWSVAKKTQEAVFTGHTEWVSSVCMSVDGR